MRFIKSFTRYEIILWSFSVSGIIIAFILFDRVNFLNLAASLIGVTSIIINAKGNPFGQALMIFFSVIYGYISFSFRYYGEMVTYLGMTMPMAAFSLVSWLRHPFKGDHSEVKIVSLRKSEYIFMLFLTLIITVIFYFILKALGTASLLFSTISVATSFAAAYLTFRRCKTFSLAYTLNDIVLIILWSIAASDNKTCISLIICFILFLANDIYGFISWNRLQKKQNN